MLSVHIDGAYVPPYITTTITEISAGCGHLMVAHSKYWEPVSTSTQFPAWKDSSDRIYNRWNCQETIKNHHEYKRRTYSSLFPLWTLKELMSTKTRGSRPPCNIELKHTESAILTSPIPSQEIEHFPVRQEERKDLSINHRSKEHLNSAKRIPLADITLIINCVNQ